MERSLTWYSFLAPAAALVALEQYRTARLQRGETVGAVVLIPDLMYQFWQM
jgi:hypothetical protein